LRLHQLPQLLQANPSSSSRGCSKPQQQQARLLQVNPSSSSSSSSSGSSRGELQQQLQRVGPKCVRRGHWKLQSHHQQQQEVMLPLLLNALPTQTLSSSSSSR
jgi:hypothetical protein